MFFITGLPRSRTKWFARYFTAHPRTYCFHELLNRLDTPIQFYDVMERQRGDLWVGNSDCGLGITDFQERWPDAPTVIIERPLEEVSASLSRVGIEVTDDMLEWFMSLLTPLEGLRVPFYDVDNRLEEINDYVGVPFHAHIAEQYKRMRIADETITGRPDALKAWVGG